MHPLLIQIVLACDTIAFLIAIFMHLTRKNMAVIRLYAVQSVVTGVLLAALGIAEGHQVLIIVAAITLVVKGVLAPFFFSRLMRRFKMEPTATNYLSVPMTLLAIMAIMTFVNTQVFKVLSVGSPFPVSYLVLTWAIILTSMFLIFNRRGAFGQIIGILSLENGIVILASLLRITQPLSLEIGIIFDLAIWIIIANVFIVMLYKQFGTLNVTEMRKLIEEE
jgi:hydrogenase-4 component E